MHRPSVRRICLASFLLLLLATPRLQAQSWMAVGPPGGDVRELAADPRDPRRIYLGTADGIVYRSDDGGMKWRRLSPGFPHRGASLDEIVVDPRSGAVLVGYWDVAGNGGGIARSDDGGKTFTMLPGIAGQSVRALAQAASNPDVLVAGTIGGVFRSVDFGKTWQRISPEDQAELKNVESVAVDPASPDVVYVGTWHLPWKTSDGGANWELIHTGMIDDSDVFTMTVDRWSSRKVYATACSGIYRSADGAGKWTRIRGIPASSRRTRSFAQSPDNQDVFYAGTTEGLWISEDGTATWRQATPKSVVVNSVLAQVGGLLLLGTDGAGVLRSSDGGRSWFTSNQGFSERFVSRIVFDPAGRRVLTGIWGDRNHGGVFTAPSPLGPWTRIGPGLEGREVLSLAVSGSQILAGTDDGLFLSSDPAAPWRRLPTLVGGVDLHPRVTDVVALSDQVLLAASLQGILRSVDGGATWRRPSLGMWGPASSLAVSGRTLGLVLASTPLGFFKSVDGGDRWVLVSRGLGSTEAHTIAFVPSDDRMVYATSTRGLFRSKDQGATWSQVTGGIPYTDITGLAIRPDGRTLYASDFTWGGIFRSQNGGETWERLSAEGLVSDRVWTLSVDPTAPDRVLVASPSGGLHMLAPAPPPIAAAGGSASPQ
jgi:photosystem II stability/assembly factor-like uncharacterized protein